MSAARLPHGTMRVANVYLYHHGGTYQGVWHLDRATAETTAKFNEKNSSRRLAYRIVARFK